MIKREDFYPILFKSLETYFKEVYNREVNVSFNYSKGSDRLFVFCPPSFIARRIPPKGLLTFLYSEYNVRNNFFKYYLGKIGVLVATRSFGLFAKASIYLDSRNVLPQNSFIAPNNRSIRIFNYDTMMVDCIIKDSFTNKFFLNQLNFRRENNYSFVPPLIDFGDQWFRESIMLGNPLARVTDEKKYKSSMSCAIQLMGIVAKDTKKFVDSGSYTSNLIKDIVKKLRIAGQKKHINSQEALLSIIKQLESILSLSKLIIPTVLSHGDLQTGNIWLDRNGKTWIYDWETNGRRSVWYDSATLLLSLRRKSGIEKMWKNYQSDAVIQALLHNDENSRYSALQIRQIVSIVILEDIQFYLDDLLELPKDFGGPIFDLFAKRLITLKYDNLDE